MLARSPDIHHQTIVRLQLAAQRGDHQCCVRRRRPLPVSAPPGLWEATVAEALLPETPHHLDPTALYRAQQRPLEVAWAMACGARAPRNVSNARSRQHDQARNVRSPHRGRRRSEQRSSGNLGLAVPPPLLVERVGFLLRASLARLSPQEAAPTPARRGALLLEVRTGRIW